VNTRTRIFCFDIVLIVLLLALAGCYLGIPALTALVPAPLRLPVHSMWFGMLGGIVISLKGIYDHPVGAAPAWDDGFTLWHIGRPVSGGVVGLMTLVLLRVVNQQTEPSEAVLYSAAFILGTQERRFFNFLSEVALLVVHVPEEQEAGGLGITEIRPTQGRRDDIIVIQGRGFDQNVVVRLGDSDVENVRVSSDGTALAGRVAGTRAGPVDVVLRNPNGTSFTRRDGFTCLENAPKA
jgi:hypothetical protein